MFAYGADHLVSAMGQTGAALQGPWHSQGGPLVGRCLGYQTHVSSKAQQLPSQVATKSHENTGTRTLWVALGPKPPTPRVGQTKGSVEPCPPQRDVPAPRRAAWPSVLPEQQEPCSHQL